MFGGRKKIRIKNPLSLATQKIISVKNQSNKPSAVKKKTFSRFRLNKQTVAVYLGLFALIISLVFIGYHNPQGTSVANVDVNSSDSVDDVVATTVAAGVAQATSLPIASSVSNLASSAQVKSEIAQSSDSTSISKPQIISGDINMSVTSYTVKAGDTVTSVATLYGLSTDTIKWANNLTSDSLTVGTILKILPVNGVLYTVKDGDTIASIATKYKVDQTRLTTYNNLDNGGLTVGSSIILPDGVLPTDERPGYVAASSYSSSSSSSSASYNYKSGSVGNLYAIGNCTWWAYERRSQLGMPVGSYWGNANTWAYAAAASGYLVDRNPSFGAVLVDQAGYYGHVAVVEKVNSDGSIVISEMNNYALGGWNIVNSRTISSSQVSYYRYIH